MLTSIFIIFYKKNEFWTEQLWVYKSNTLSEKNNKQSCLIV